MIINGELSNKKIIIYGLERYSFAIRTILSHRNISVFAYLVNEESIKIAKTREVLDFVCKYMNSSDSKIEIMTIEDLMKIDLDKYVILYGFAAQKGKWNDCGNLYYNQPDNEDTMDKVMHCLWSTCYTLENHLIGRCARSIPALTLQGIERKESNYINIDEHITIEKILGE